MSTIWLIYDGDCPICRNFSKALKIRSAVGELKLINARENHALVEEIKKRGIDLNEGIVVKMNDQLYYAVDAFHVLALLSSDVNWFNKANGWLFRRKLLCRLTYPVLKQLRNILLKIRRVQRI